MDKQEKIKNIRQSMETLAKELEALEKPDSILKPGMLCAFSNESIENCKEYIEILMYLSYLNEITEDGMYVDEDGTPWSYCLPVPTTTIGQDTEVRKVLHPGDPEVKDIPEGQLVRWWVSDDDQIHSLYTDVWCKTKQQIYNSGTYYRNKNTHDWSSLQVLPLNINQPKLQEE